MIKILEPSIGFNEKKEVLKALEKKEISTFGNFSKVFTKKVQKINKSVFNIALTSGSVALYLANKICVADDNNIIIAPSYTFIATISSIVNMGATPWLFDISSKNLCIDIDQLEKFMKHKTFKKKNYYFSKKTNQKISVINLVLTFSIIPDLQRIKKFAKKYNLKVVIDAACAFGSKFNNKPLTDFADIVVYSFNGNKSFTAGGGGMLSTNNKRYFDKASLLANNGKSDLLYNYKEFGYNFKITNLHAALGIGQLKNYNKILKSKRKIQNLYEDRIINKEITFLSKYLNSKHDFWINFIILESVKKANKIIKYLNHKNIKTYLFWKPIHLQKFAHQIKKEKMNFTNSIWNRLVPLPSSSNLNKKTQDYVIKQLNDFK